MIRRYMALLIDIGLPGWMKDEELYAVLAPLLPDVTIHCGTPEREMPDVTMIAVAEAVRGIWSLLPNLQCVQKLGAGVNLILADPGLPAHVRVARMAPDTQAVEIAEYCLTAVLARQRDFEHYRVSALSGDWRPVEPRKNADTTVAVLGLGHIGRRTAELFVSLGFAVKGWSRAPKSIAGVECFDGVGGLSPTLADSDYVIAVLPSTDATRDLFDRELFGQFKPDAVLINVGRGDAVVEGDLLAALDAGQLGGAVLDVFRREPLPADDPLWSHAKVLVTPHVSGWHLDGGLEDVAENYRRLTAGQPLLHEVDKASGY